ncbi:MAG TPA: hypothetical protein IAB35_06340 [Candidatus Faecimonas gallistercoris]|nr:hypothetical protein [Candidatus Faecimonas gallistercoris]
MEIIKKNEAIQLVENQKVIEEYKFDNEINFSKLMEYLLSLNLSKKITLDDKVSNKKLEEENLLKIITNIINDYNNKTEELETFKKEIENKD